MMYNKGHIPIGEIDRQYRNALITVLQNGFATPCRNGTMRAVYGYSFNLPLCDGVRQDNIVPVPTLRTIKPEHGIWELDWKVNGHTNVKYLHDKYDYHAWDPWTDESGDAGPIYGQQWRHGTAYNLGGIDHMETLLHNLRAEPYSRRHILSAWDSTDIFYYEPTIPPCLPMIQFACPNDTDLVMIVTARSMDLLYGYPYNVIMDGVLAHLIARVTRRRAVALILNVGVLHYYTANEDAIGELAGRPCHVHAPVLAFNQETKDFLYPWDFEFQKMSVNNAQFQGPLKSKTKVVV